MGAIDPQLAQLAVAEEEANADATSRLSLSIQYVL
jgi:hypothetical protein